ncbi:MAG: ABC transporter permease [Chloroflexi bacterium]|nr:ABC transporter permease [Chloroflexota bacterium]
MTETRGKDEQGRKQKSGAKRILTPEATVSILTVLLVIVVWYYFTDSLIPKLFFPSPMDTVLVVGRMEGVLVEYFIATMYRVVVGMLAGAILGVLCGIAMSWNKWINSILDPLIEALRPIPAVALIPFFILWFGIGDMGKLILTALGGFTVMVVTTLEAIKHVSPIYVMAARTLGANRLTIYRTVILPAITPPLIAGMRVTVALSFALVIASEFMGAQSGLGYMIMLARRTLQTDAILVGVIIIGITSWIVDRMVRIIGNYLTRWAPRSE